MSLSFPSRDVREESYSGSNPWGLAAICSGVFMVTLDGAALNLALPTIQQEFQSTVSQLEWIVTAYTLPLAGLLLTAGALGDRRGARRLFIAAMLAFSFASLLCALSSSLSFLIVSRLLQGVAAAGLLPMVLSLVAKSWQDKVERARAVNMLATIGGVAMVVGPIGGGWMTEYWGWRSIFLINLPMGLLGAWLTYQYLRETSLRRVPLDFVGVSLGTLALTSLVAGLIESNTLGGTHPLVIGLIAGGMMGIMAFIWAELHVPHPMLPLRIFRNRPFSAAVAGGFAFQFSCYGLLFMLALFVQHAWQVTPLRAGTLLLPFAIAVILTTAVLNPGLRKNGARWMLWVGGSWALLGGVVALWITTPATWPIFVLGTVLIGIGTGIYSPALNLVATTTVDPACSGLASGIYNTSRQIGMALGIAILGSLVGGAIPALIGLRIGLLLIIACLAGVVVLALRYIKV